MAYTQFFKVALNDKTEYVFIDPRKKTHYAMHDRRGFSSAVSFWQGPSDFSSNYPVVFDDYTTSDGRTLEKISYEDVPAAIKARFTKWKRLQG